MIGKAMAIPPDVLVHVRKALLGATGVAIEDLGTLNSDLEAECDRKEESPDGYGKRAAYHEGWQAANARHELQRRIGLPGDPLTEVKLRGRSAEGLLVEFLTDYRDALVARRDVPYMEEAKLAEADEWLEVIDSFLVNWPVSNKRAGEFVA
jgi:hypothetical protein